MTDAESTQTGDKKSNHRPMAPRRKGSGGIFAVRDGVWRVDIELPRDPVTRRRRLQPGKFTALGEMRSLLLRG